MAWPIGETGSPQPDNQMLFINMIRADGFEFDANMVWREQWEVQNYLHEQLVLGNITVDDIRAVGDVLALSTDLAPIGRDVDNHIQTILDPSGNFIDVSDILGGDPEIGNEIVEFGSDQVKQILGHSVDFTQYSDRVGLGTAIIWSLHHDTMDGFDEYYSAMVETGHPVDIRNFPSE